MKQFIIALILCFPMLKWIIGILVLLIIGLIIGLVVYFFSTYDERQEKNMKEKFGEDYHEKIQKGELGLMVAATCKPDPTYTSKTGIERIINITLPNFSVKECSETLSDFTGDYSGEAIIEFDEEINERIIRQIEADMANSQSKWRKGVIIPTDNQLTVQEILEKPSNWREDEDLYVCDLLEPFKDNPSDDVFWSITIRKGSKEGKIIYGQV